MSTRFISLDQIPFDGVNELFTRYLVPRPIAWVLTSDGAGRLDVAPFSSFAPVCNSPPLVLFSAGRRERGAMKLTARNIMATREFVVHLVDRSMIEIAVGTAVPGENATDKFCNLDMAPSSCVRIARLSRCPVSLECRLHQHVLLGASVDLLIGEVLCMWVDDDFCDIEIVGALGVGRYVVGGDVVELSNPEESG